ncbi:YigZ family protein [Sporofaciens sp. SGI.106]|uniref:YigZ family protein n=1 Tax=Sporofaciens sp. SGI.106 TaxID=3420568 RepID=UPI002A95E975|nr:YigZ family protein [Lachnoclostridium sp.]
MLSEYRIAYKGGEGEIVEKKSRFIATVLPVDQEEEALEFIEKMKKKYWNATHNCYAYVVGDRHEIQRYSDDGEPGGTAGRPMLDVLLGEDIHNVAVVVTRYFGGTLLGTGGLVRAYSSATKAGLASSVIITKIPGFKLRITTDYTGLGKIQYILGERKIPILDTVYTDKVEMQLVIPAVQKEQVTDALIEGTNGKVQFGEAESCYYAEINKEILVL